MPPSKKNDKSKSTSSRAQPSQQTSRASTSASSQPGTSSSQATQSKIQSQAEKIVSNFDKDELKQKVTDLVQYLLIMWQKNNPIKKIDINKHVLKEHKAAFNHIMDQAKDNLATVFGIDVVELQDKKGSFILVNRLENDPDNLHLNWPESEQSKMALLLVLLSFIYMNGNVMQDSEMWHALRKLGIDTSMVHPVFGDAKKLITQEFVRQGYLEYIRQPNSDPPTYDFKWGQRSQMETSKRNCLAFVSEIYGMQQTQWTSQYQDMINADGEDQ